MLLFERFFSGEFFFGIISRAKAALLDSGRKNEDVKMFMIRDL